MDCNEGMCDHAPEFYCYGCDQPYCNHHIYRGDDGEFYCSICINEDDADFSW